MWRCIDVVALIIIQAWSHNNEQQDECSKRRRDKYWVHVMLSVNSLNWIHLICACSCPSVLRHASCSAPRLIIRPNSIDLGM